MEYVFVAVCFGALLAAVIIAAEELLSRSEIRWNLFRCRHRTISRVFSRINGVPAQHYVFCMDCCKRLRYDWRTMEVREEIPEEIADPRSSAGAESTAFQE